EQGKGVWSVLTAEVAHPLSCGKLRAGERLRAQSSLGSSPSRLQSRRVACCFSALRDGAGPRRYWGRRGCEGLGARGQVLQGCVASAVSTSFSPAAGFPLSVTGRPSAARWGSSCSHLRHVEKDVLIPKIMREKARERCSEQVEDFTRCCKDSGILMVLKCRKENSALKDCLTAYYNDPAFYEECKLEYLKEREEFRRTGVPTKKRLQKLPTSM
uniref:C-x(9)-C motif containing 1 n=2 Tax=Rattus norvegicus TaxID=10116 RepID=D3ZTN2_RAT